MPMLNFHPTFKDKKSTFRNIFVADFHNTNMYNMGLLVVPMAVRENFFYNS